MHAPAISVAETLSCHACEHPGRFADAREVASVPSNVREFKHERFTVWRCVHCGSLNSKEAVDLDHYYANYPSTRQTLDYFARRGFTRRLDHLKRHGLRPSHTVLDYGCGKGLFVDFLRAAGFPNVSGFDPYLPRFADRAALATTYDFVLNQDVLEHVPAPRETFAEWVRLLKPQGHLVVGTPDAADFDLSLLDDFVMGLHQPYHRTIFSRGALRALAKSHRLTEVHFSNRWFNDTLFPFANTRFGWSYAKRHGQVVDVFFDKPDIASVLLSPKLLWQAFTGYFSPPPGNMLATFRAMP